MDEANSTTYNECIRTLKRVQFSTDTAIQLHVSTVVAFLVTQHIYVLRLLLLEHNIDSAYQ